MTLESSIEEDLRRSILAAGGLCIKLPALWYRGIPDRMVLLPIAKVLFVELKQTKGRASKTQVAFHNLLFRIGFKVHIIKGRDQLMEFLSHVDVQYVPRSNHRRRA